MLVVRREQIETLEQRALHDYKERLCERLLRQYPVEAGAFGDQRLHALVDEGVVRAGRYGLDSERSVALFVDLMLFLGPRLDEDPGLPWAAEILNDELILDQGLRIDTLHERAVQFISESESGVPGADKV